MPANSDKVEILEIIFKKHHENLCKRAFNITGDHDAAKDIVQEVFIKIWKKQEDIVLEDRIKYYLLKATTNTALNYLKSKHRFEEVKEEMSTTATSNSHVAEEDPAHLEELRRSIGEAIDKLPPKCKVIYQLCRQEAMSYMEIANHLDISVKTVENQMGIALKKLRQDLKTYMVFSMLIPPIVLFVWSMLNQ